MLTAPAYHEPFTAPGTDPMYGWAADLSTDPRRRGGAGLGRWAAVAWQDRIADAAAVRVGDLAVARDRVGHLALGLEAARSLWRRHVPPDSDPVGRLAVLAPVLGRLPSTDGGTVLQTITGRTPRLAAALWSSAARRALRPGPGPDLHRRVGRRTTGGCPRNRRHLRGLARGPRRDPARWRRRRRLPAGAHGDARAAEPAGRGSALRETGPRRARPARRGRRGPDRRAAGGRRSRARHAAGHHATSARSSSSPSSTCRCGASSSQASPDWLLPGVGDLAENDVAGLATNPGFVESFLVGANRGTAAELRWRNMPMRSRWSPLRKFWQRRSGGDGHRADRRLAGDGAPRPRLAAAGAGGTEAVVVFRTTLFRRYPGTAVYLYRDASGTGPRRPTTRRSMTGRKVAPSFTGTIGDDVSFFGFPIAPSALTDHWVVLEEPPSGYRFFTEGAVFPSPATTAAQYAYDTFAVPVRVMIGQLMEGA